MGTCVVCGFWVWVSGLSFWPAVMVGWWDIVCTFDVGGLWVVCGCLWYVGGLCTLIRLWYIGLLR